ncbi:MAG: immunoglobulin-like domain-containing protein [Agathobacter sp.]
MNLSTKDEKGEVTVQVPINQNTVTMGYVECGVWEKLDPAYLGIYRTEYVPNGSEYRIDVWGVYKYDETQGDTCTYSNKVTVVDNYENATTESAPGNYDTEGKSGNIKPQLKFGVLDEVTGEFVPGTVLDAEGNVGVYCEQPLESITGYGAASVQMHINSDGKTYFFSTLPMIMADGSYKVQYKDLFGSQYEQELQITAFGDENMLVDISNMDVTNQNVSVSVKALLENDTILSIEAVYEDGTTASGTIDVLDPARANIIMEKNGQITVTTETVTKTIKICNIDKEKPQGIIAFCYNGGASPNFYVDAAGNQSADTITQMATAIVQCSEPIEAVEGTLSYTFPEGSQKGETHTFKFTDKAGNTNEITATLPYNIYKAPEPQVDESAPEYRLDVMGLRNNTLMMVDTFYTPVNSSGVNAAFGMYKAQSYVLNLDIKDQSETKMIVKECGAAAPTSYASAKSDEIEGVWVSKNSITIVNNQAAFDLYILDSQNNVTSLSSVCVNGIDREAPKVEVQYETKNNENGELYIRALFIPENDEEIFPRYGNVGTVLVTDENERTVSRYYHDFEENANYTFFYKDIYGNEASVNAEVSGLDTASPAVNALVWYGLSGIGEEPAQSDVVNRTVTAEISVNKAVSEVNLYHADPSASDGKGAPIGEQEALPIRVSFVGQKVTIYYDDVVDQEIVVELRASSNGRKVTRTLPAVTCIDKKAPEVTSRNGTLASDKKSYTVTMTTDEDTRLAEDIRGELAKEHTWTTYVNGEYMLHLSDKAGNIKEVPVSVNDIDDKVLELSYSTTLDGANAVSDATTLDLKEGMSLYVKSTKKVTLQMLDQEKTVEAGTWTALQLTGGDGFYSIKATDVSTGETIYANLHAALLDKKPPVFRLNQDMVFVSEGSSEEVLDTAIRTGVTVIDDRDGFGTEFEYKVQGVDKVSDAKAGTYTITYTAKDSSGNEATATRVLYIYSLQTPMFSINQVTVQPYGTTIVDDATIQLNSLNEKAGSAVTLKWKAGIQTTAQMKYEAVKVKAEEPFVLPKPGFYTLYVRAQDRQEYVTYIYVQLQETNK